MKKLLVMGAIFCAAVTSQASLYGSRDTLAGQIGFSQAAVGFGAEYEHRLDTMGVGGYFNYSSEEKTAVKNQLMSFGGIAPIHLLDDTKLDVSIAPGFGITMVKGINGAEDQTVFGPLWKLSTYFKMNSSVKVGIQHTQLVNWFSNKLPANTNYTNFSVAFAF
jgi:hypothetical protein